MRGVNSQSVSERSRFTRIGALAIPLAVAALLPATAGAATIDVDTFGESVSGDPNCSLREAVIAANVNGNGHEPDCEAGGPLLTSDSIQLDAGTYTLAGPAGENLNAGGDLDIAGDGDLIFILGAADANGVPTTTINANNVDRVFDLPVSVNDNSLFLSKVTLRNGNAPGGAPAGDGGAVRILDPDAFFMIVGGRILDSDAGHYGGGIFFDGGDAASTVNVIQTEIAGNTAGSEGGGIWLDQHYDGDFNVTYSSLTANSADMGGAIYLGTRVADAIQLDMLNSTVSGNTASQAGGALAFDNSETGNAFFFYSTIASNTSDTAASGGGVHTVAAAPSQFVYFGRSIVAGNTAGGASSNCFGPGNFQSAGYSLESANSCGFDTTPPTTDLVNTDPMLAPLSAYPASASATIPLGGAPPPGQLTTKTRALYVGSPALNRIPRSGGDDCFGSQGYDQRYVLRPTAPDGLCDIGAFEGSIPKPAGGPVVKCGGKTATKVGTAGKDKLVGTNKADVIAGLGGKDTIKGRGGKDVLCGNGGKDKLIGGKGKDRLLGAKGRDTLKGGPGKDKLKGGPGRDRQVQ